MTIKKLDGYPCEVWRISPDVNGNPRYVVHYLAVPYEGDDSQPFHVNQTNHIEHARRALYGRRYRAKWFGGGIVFQTYNLRETLAKAGVR